MADRVYIIPRRNDLAGVGLCLHDLHPNAGQQSRIYEGEHQNVYVAEMIDVPGATAVNGIAYVSGSLNTTLDGTHNDVADDTTGGGNDVTATQATAFGLAAYLLDRVQQAGAGGAPLTVAQANAASLAIMQAAHAGNALTLAAINVLLVAAAGAGTELTNAGGSASFGTVGDILRILTGEVYRVPRLTALGTNVNVFLALAGRQAIVNAQTPVQIAAQGQFYNSGGFLSATDAGYRARPVLVPTGAFNISVIEGVVAHYAAAAGITLLNSNNFAYTAGAVTAWKPRATRLDQVAVPATGIARAIAVYDQDGNNLA